MQGFVSARFFAVVAGSILVATVPALGDHAVTDGGKKAASGWLAKIDKNGDGAIDRTEFDAWRYTIFVKIDSNGDQTLSLDEWQAARARMHQHLAGDAANENTQPSATSQAATTAPVDGRPASPRGQKWFRLADANGDQKISADEWRLVSDKMFNRRDANKDGSISSDEFAMRHDRKPSEPVPQ